MAGGCCSGCPSEAKRNDRLWRRVLWVALAVNAVMFGVEITAGVAAGSAYALGSTFAALPAHCAYAPIGPAPYYNCSGYWLKPAYGAGGVYYTVVPTP